MQRQAVRAAAIAAGLAIVLQACGSSATPSPSSAPVAVSSLSASITPASIGPSASPQPSASTAVIVPSTAPSPSPAPSTSPAPSAASSAGPADLGGTWKGKWQDTTPDTSGGSFTLTWKQQGSDLAGSIVIGGTPCLSGAAVNGKISGSKISFGVVSGRVTITYTGSFSTNKMSGTYSAPKCGEAQGTWEASR